MGDMKLGAIETRFAEIIWANAPLTTNQLIKLCAEELEWKRTTTYTVLKKLCESSINSASANNDSEEGYVGLIEVADCQKDVLVPKYVSYGDRGFHVTKFGMGSVVFTNEAGSVVESVTIPNTTYVINKNVLAGCPNLKTVVVDSENPYYDSRENCNAIITTSQNPYFTPNTLIAGCKTTIIPNSVVEIGANAFYNCQSLETITIPNRL